MHALLVSEWISTSVTTLRTFVNVSTCLIFTAEVVSEIKLNTNYSKVMIEQFRC
jgi:hypothetical protein